MEFEYLKKFGDDITFCVAECKTDCRRKVEYVFHKDRPYSYSNFSSVCKAYRTKEKKNAN